MTMTMKALLKKVEAPIGDMETTNVIHVSEASRCFVLASYIWSMVLMKMSVSFASSSCRFKESRCQPKKAQGKETVNTNGLNFWHLCMQLY